MRIHRLRLRGIGPFLAEQAIDFDELGRNGLFLLDGPTGAGKSTIIDALVFALFGSTAAEAGRERIVSDFLGAGITRATRPFVEVVLTTGSGVYRVLREPGYEHLNTRGRITSQGSTVRVEQLANEDDPQGRILTDRVDEAGRLITAAVGMDKGQVLSTMFLAQGQFATFLRARSDERRQILQTVFNTERYRRIEELLVQGRRDALASRRTARESFGQAVAVLRSRLDLGVDQEALAQLALTDPAAATALVDAALGALQSQEHLAARVAQAADEAVARCAAEHERVRERGTLVERKRQLLAQQRSVAAAGPEVAGIEGQIERARAALLVEPHAAAARERRGALRQACERASDVVDALDPAERTLGSPQLGALADRSAEQAVGLQRFVELEAELPGSRAELAGLAAAIKDSEARIAAAEERMGQLPELIATAAEAQETAALTAAGLDRALADHGEAHRAIERLRAVADLQLQHRAAVARAEGALAELDLAEQAASDTALRYRAGVAAELAATLEPRHPCPVCGSPEHPALARRQSGHVGAREVDRAEELRRAAAGRAEAAAREVGELTARIAGEQALTGGRTTDDVEADLGRATEAVSAAREAQARAEQLRAQVQLLTGGLREVSEALGSGRGQRAELCRDHERAQGRLEELEAQLHGARAGFATVAARQRELVRRRELLRTARDAVAAQVAAQVEVEQAEQQLRRALSDAGFPDEASQSEASRDPGWVAQAQDRVAEHRRDAAMLAGALADPALSSVGADEQVDTSSTQAALDAARAGLETARSGHITLVNALQAARQSWRQVRAELASVERTDAGTAAAIRLGDLASAAGSGPNQVGIPLSTYVVIRRFEQVVEAANERLAEMSDGRYRLEASADGVGQERRRGLALRVHDDRTDSPRGPETLSGGETFYVSLALALGLADVVQSEAGGIRLETLFVDEGFGSLDPETLDTVMNVLTRLGRGQRTVGLISHVEEMKRRIPDRVHIQRTTPNGPSQVITGEEQP